jgi:hypothetical protein
MIWPQIFVRPDQFLKLGVPEKVTKGTGDVQI